MSHDLLQQIAGRKITGTPRAGFATPGKTPGRYKFVNPDFAIVQAIAPPIDAPAPPPSITYVVTSNVQDRDGDILLPSGCNYANWERAGAPWFFNHQSDHYPLPIGSGLDPATRKCSIRIEPDRILATCWFDTGSAFAMDIYRLASKGILRACSIGFQPLEIERIRDQGKAAAGRRNSAVDGYLISSWDLHEVSAVGIGSQPNALIDELGKGYSALVCKALVPWTRALGTVTDTSSGTLPADDDDEKAAEPVGTDVQAIVIIQGGAFPELADAQAWIQTQGYEGGGVAPDLLDGAWTFTQFPAEELIEDTAREETLADGVRATVGQRRTETPVETPAKRAKDFREGDHPRADDGKFGSGGGSANGSGASKPKDKPTNDKAKYPAVDTTGVTVTADKETHAAFKGLTGKEFTTEHVCGLTGAEPGSQISVEAFADGSLAFRTKGEKFESTRELRTAADGKLVLHNKFFEVNRKAQGQGLGSQIFARQVSAAAAAGVDRIKTLAAGYAGSEENGYYTWPRMGYDGAIPPKVAAKLPDEFKDAKTLHDLMSAPGGRDWWKANGKDAALSFDLNEGSTSRRVFDAYLAESAAKRATKAAAGTQTKGSGGKGENPDLADWEDELLDRLWDHWAKHPAKHAKALGTVNDTAGGALAKHAKDFREGDHPRADDGKFGSGGGSSGSAASDKPAKKDGAAHTQPNAALPAAARPPLTDAEAAAVKSYTGPNSGRINGALRSGTTPKSDAGAAHEALQGLFAELKPFDKPVKVYRGLEFDKGDSRGQAFKDKLKEAAKSGNGLQFGGYSSTSTNAKIAGGMAGSVRFEIEALKGLDCKSFSTNPIEDELLLDHNSTFQVLKVQDKGGTLHVKLRQVLTAASAKSARFAKASASGKNRFVDEGHDHISVVRLDVDDDAKSAPICNGKREGGKMADMNKATEEPDDKKKPKKPFPPKEDGEADDAAAKPKPGEGDTATATEESPDQAAEETAADPEVDEDGDPVDVAAAAAGPADSGLPGLLDFMRGMAEILQANPQMVQFMQSPAFPQMLEVAVSMAKPAAAETPPGLDDEPDVDDEEPPVDSVSDADPAFPDDVDDEDEEDEDEIDPLNRYRRARVQVKRLTKRCKTCVRDAAEYMDEVAGHNDTPKAFRPGHKYHASQLTKMLDELEERGGMDDDQDQGDEGGMSDDEKAAILAELKSVHADSNVLLNGLLEKVG